MVSNVDVKRVNWKGVGVNWKEPSTNEHIRYTSPTLKNSDVIQQYNNQQLRMDWDIHNNIHSINNNTHDMGR